MIFLAHFLGKTNLGSLFELSECATLFEPTGMPPSQGPKHSALAETPLGEQYPPAESR